MLLVTKVHNPANGKVLGRVPDMNRDDVAIAIDAARVAFDSWRQRTPKERSDALRRWHTEIVREVQHLATVLTLENGKTLRDAQGEMGSSISNIEWFAEEARRIYGDVVPSSQPTKRAIVLRQPIGVVGAITPWNFPSSMVHLSSPI
jgi:acyl-CoA reductase-like NAD-dependent aldehyde dehydrogenase